MTLILGQIKIKVTVQQLLKGAMIETNKITH